LWKEAEQMTDLIIGCFTNYKWDTVQYWANSIKQCGFGGDFAAIFYNTDDETKDNLIRAGFILYPMDPTRITRGFAYAFPFEVMLHRFFAYYEFLSTLTDIDKYRYVIATDVRDVVFQSDPSVWLEQNMGDKKICASCESLRYRDEPWGNASMSAGYPLLYEYMAARPIWNAGVQAGEIKLMRDFWLQLSLAGAAAFEAADQATYNILLSLRPWSDTTLFTMGEDGWACQVGTQALEQPALMEPAQRWDGSHSITSLGRRHAILHQYTRITQWRECVERVYGSPSATNRHNAPSMPLPCSSTPHPRDISTADLELAMSAADRPDLLRSLVQISRGAFGFFTSHFPHTINYPWTAKWLEKLPAAAHVLDIGAGVSPLPLWLAERGCLVNTVDNHSMVRTLPATDDWNEWGFFDYGQLHQHLTAHHCAVQDFTPTSPFDAIYSVSVLAHMPREHRDLTLNCCRQWLRPGGTLLLAIDLIPSSDFLWSRSEGREVEPVIKHGATDDVLRKLEDLEFSLKSLKTFRKVYKSRTDLLCIICTKS
jgi:SAM-dependent methyltransferase